MQEKNNLSKKGIGLTLLIAVAVFTVLTILLIGILGQFVDTTAAEFHIYANHPTRREVAVNTLTRTNNTLEKIIYDVSTPSENGAGNGDWTVGQTVTYESTETGIKLASGTYQIELEGEDGDDGDSCFACRSGCGGGDGGYVEGTIQVDEDDEFDIYFISGQSGGDGTMGAGDGGDGGYGVYLEHNNDYIAEAAGGGGGGGGALVDPLSVYSGGDGGDGGYGSDGDLAGDGGDGGTTYSSCDDGEDGSFDANLDFYVGTEGGGGAPEARITFGEKIVDPGEINETIERIFPDENVGLEVRDQDQEVLARYGENFDEIENKMMVAPRTIPLPEGNKATIWVVVEDPMANI